MDKKTLALFLAILHFDDTNMPLQFIPFFQNMSVLAAESAKTGKNTPEFNSNLSDFLSSDFSSLESIVGSKKANNITIIDTERLIYYDTKKKLENIYPENYSMIDAQPIVVYYKNELNGFFDILMRENIEYILRNINNPAVFSNAGFALCKEQVKVNIDVKADQRTETINPIFFRKVIDWYDGNSVYTIGYSVDKKLVLSKLEENGITTIRKPIDVSCNISQKNDRLLYNAIFKRSNANLLAKEIYNYLPSGNAISRDALNALSKYLEMNKEDRTLLFSSLITENYVSPEAWEAAVKKTDSLTDAADAADSVKISRIYLSANKVLIIKENTDRTINYEIETKTAKDAFKQSFDRLLYGLSTNPPAKYDPRYEWDPYADGL